MQRGQSESAMFAAGWAVGVALAAVAVKQAVTARGPMVGFAMTRSWLWSATVVIAVAGGVLAWMAARRGRVEVAAALLAGFGVYGFVVCWMRLVG